MKSQSVFMSFTFSLQVSSFLRIFFSAMSFVEASPRLASVSSYSSATNNNFVHVNNSSSSVVPLVHDSGIIFWYVDIASTRS